MTNAPGITDVEITEMLLDRVAPMPTDLTGTVLSSLRAARVGGRAARGRSGFKPLLLVAAALALAGGLAVVATTGRQPDDPTRVSQQPVAEASASVRQKLVIAPTDAPQQLCPSLDDAARVGGLDTGPQPVAGAAPATASNGQVLLLAGAAANPSVFDPSSPEPSPTRLATWDLGSLAVNAWTATHDGTVVAAEVATDACASQIWVMRTDGSSLRRPFAAARHDAFGPSWSPDGSLLAFATGPAFDARNQPASESTLLVWDAATGTTRDLGRPCPECVTVTQEYGHATPVWSPDGDRLATGFANLGCGVSSDTPCRGIAIASLDGSWSIVPVADPGRATTYHVMRWVDARTLLVKKLPGGSYHVDISTGAATPYGTLPTGVSVPFHRLLSPDGSMSLRTTGGAGIDVIHIASSTSTHIEPFPINQLDAAWSPDSRYVLVQAANDEFTSSDIPGVYLAPVDGSERPRLILEGGYGTMVWLQAVPHGP